MANLEALIEERHKRGEWVVFHELADQTGGAGTRLDVAAFNVWNSKRGHRIAYEVKRSRSDFLRELAQPDKRAWAEDAFHETYFVCAPDVAKKEEIPEGWGLLVPTKDGEKLRRVVIARQREPRDLTWRELGAVLRQAAKAMEAVTWIDGESVTPEIVNRRVERLVSERLLYESQRLVQATERERKSAQAHEDAERALKQPLEVLHGLFINPEKRMYAYPAPLPNGLTAAVVRDWYAAIVKASEAKAAESLRKRIDTAHASLGELLRAVDGAGA